MIGFDERDVPADVRDRITGTVHRGMVTPTRRGLRTPLAVAASVAVLVVVGLLVARPDHPRQIPAGPHPSTGTPSSATPAVDLDRCWNAVVAKGKQQDFPPRSAWAPLMWQPSTSASVTAWRAQGKTFFCMTTTTTVTVTDPDAKITPVSGTSYKVALTDDTGWVVGTAPVSGDYVMVERGGTEFGVQPAAGVFLIHVAAEHDLGSRVRMDGKQIPAVPAPAVTVVDHPLPAPDRTSGPGKRLGECIDEAGWPKAYADQWQAVGIAEHGGRYLVFATSGNQFATCTNSAPNGNEYDFVPMDPLPASSKPQLLELRASMLFSAPQSHYRRFLVGNVPPGTTRMDLTFGDGSTVMASLSGDMWVVFLGSGTSGNPSAVGDQAAVTEATVRGAGGKITYNGPPVIIPSGK